MLEITFTAGNANVDLVIPHTLTLYQCGCAEVHVDAMIPSRGIECDYMPLTRITDVENGGRTADHSLHPDEKCGMLTGASGALSAYCDFLKYYGLVPHFVRSLPRTISQETSSA